MTRFSLINSNFDRPLYVFFNKKYEAYDLTYNKSKAVKGTREEMESIFAKMKDRGIESYDSLKLIEVK